MFIYSRRVGTQVIKWKIKFQMRVKHERFDRLKELVEPQIAEKNKKYVDTVQYVLVEGKSKNNADMLTGRTDSNKVVFLRVNMVMLESCYRLRLCLSICGTLKGELKNNYNFGCVKFHLKCGYIHI